MPGVSQFFGIAIYMYYNDHLPPHFHAEYGGNEALYEIDTLRVYAGKLPRRAHNLVIEWADLHRNELWENWGRARRGEDLNDIEELE
ncbi:MAG: DUF4160 domain-containing protein [candidate division KSB1 bacterium]|nr:DUF4160 domain-containing protein [candidate division KSB1 bacterium]MDZ7303769.1 DUF4160 domain-containing protein [candidate division KSB1 bacterium]MDZ7313028.1 DUF4160 domain-containing protein [candidate division KSB1 bacterium]